MKDSNFSKVAFGNALYANGAAFSGALPQMYFGTWNNAALGFVFAAWVVLTLFAVSLSNEKQSLISKSKLIAIYAAFLVMGMFITSLILIGILAISFMAFYPMFKSDLVR